MFKIEIDKDIPIPFPPKVRGRQFEWQRIIKDMEKGDSIFIPGCTHHQHVTINEAFRSIGYESYTEQEFKGRDYKGRRFWRVK